MSFNHTPTRTNSKQNCLQVNNVYSKVSTNNVHMLLHEQQIGPHVSQVAAHPLTFNIIFDILIKNVYEIGIQFLCTQHNSQSEFYDNDVLTNHNPALQVTRIAISTHAWRAWISRMIDMLS